MNRNDRLAQLSLFVELGQEEALVEPICDSITAYPNLMLVDIEVLRDELLTWGAIHHYPAFSFPYVYPLDDQERRWGLLWSGKLLWRRNIANPNQRDRYPGEWLVKAVDQIKRYNSGMCDIPEQITHIPDDRE